MKRNTKRWIWAGLGAVLAVFATVFIVKKGPELKEKLTAKVEDLKLKVKDIEASDVKDAITAKLTEIKAEIQSFDWEKSKEDVQQKYYELKKKLKTVKKHVPLTEEPKEIEGVE